MKKELTDNLELLAVEAGELADVVYVIFAGLQTDGMDMEKALSCISYIKEGLVHIEEKINNLLEKTD